MIVYCQNGERISTERANGYYVRACDGMYYAACNYLYGGGKAQEVIIGEYKSEVQAECVIERIKSSAENGDKIYRVHTKDIEGGGEY